MRTFPRLLCVMLLVAFGVSAGLGWGNMTHVYFAKHLGVKVSVHDLNEIYGALLTDLAGYDFSADGLTLDNAFHHNTDLMWAFYGTAKSSPARAVFYGMFTHNARWGIDSTAHTQGLTITEHEGWVIHYSKTIEVPITNYLISLFEPRIGATYAAALAAGFAPSMGHTLIEQAVDVRVKWDKDPLVGPRLYLAAKQRSNEVPKVLGSVLGAMLGPETGAAIAAGEAQYRDAMMQYGQLFALPDDEMIPTMCGLTASLGIDFLKAGVAGSYPDLYPYLFPEGNEIVIDPAQVAEFLAQAISVVTPVYDSELQATMQLVGQNLLTFGPPPAGPVYAFAGNGGLEEELLTEDPALAAPTAFALAQNYPNPFNPSTRIAYALPNAGQVTLTVYNMLGQEVATLVNETRPAGRYEAIWDASGMPSGIYFCRLQSGSLTETKRMTLVK